MVVIPAVVAGLSAMSVSVTSLGLIVWGSFSWASFGTTLVLGGLSRLMAPSSKRSRAGSTAGVVKTGGIAQAIKQPIITRKIVYGEMRVGDGLVFSGSSEGNKYLHMVITLAAHEIAEIGEVWLDDYSIPSDWLNASGMVTQGRYANLVRIKKHLGSTGQSADSDMVSAIAGWTTAHRLAGIAYIYLRFEWNNDSFPNGIPNPSAWVRGKSVFDTRDSLSRFTGNIALFVNDYLRSDAYGFSALASEIDATFLNASANICDEFVTTPNGDTVVSSLDAATDIITLVGTSLKYQRGDKAWLTTTGNAPAGLAIETNYYVIPYQRQTTSRIKLATTYANALEGIAIDITDAGTGTHTIRKIAEPRYAGAIQIDTANAIGENVKDILSGMGGQLVYAGGQYLVQASGYQTPTVYFDENDMIGRVTCATKVSRRERFNTVQGTYIDPTFSGQSLDYPKVTNSGYVTQDGGYEIVKKIDYPATQRSGTCQRLSKIQIEKMRQEITWSCEFNLSAFQVQVGDTAYFTFAPMGWADKIFEIVSWELGSRTDENNIQAPIITMGMRETASAIYDWNNGEETQSDPAPNTTLPDPFSVAGVTGLAVDSEQIITAGLDYTYKILMHWNAHENQFVTSGGFIEIGFKKTTDEAWRPTYTVPGASTFAEVTLAAALNTQYDIRIRAVNSLGVRSSYTSLLAFTVGSSGGVGTTNDWGNWTDAIGAYNDYGNWTDAVGTTDDWGYFT